MGRWQAIRWLAVALLASMTIHAGAMDVRVLMLAEGRALLSVDGKQHMVRAGNRSPEGLLLIAADQRQAVVEWQGERKTLRLDRGIASHFTGADKVRVSIGAGAGGHHFAQGHINGFAVEFMVDTGATAVSMNYLMAERLGLNYRAGKPVMMNTANGVKEAWLVILDRVAVGNLEYTHIEGVVSSTRSPDVILLGNSFLGKVDLRVENGLMILQQK